MTIKVVNFEDTNDRYYDYLKYSGILLTNDWINDKEVVNNVACLLNFKIKSELLSNLYNELLDVLLNDNKNVWFKTLYLDDNNIPDSNFFGLRRINEWPSRFKALSQIKEKFSFIEKNDLDNYYLIWLRNNSVIRPHADTPLILHKRYKYIGNTHVTTQNSGTIHIPIGPDINNYTPLEIYNRNKIYMLKEKKQKQHRIYVKNSDLLHAVFNNDFHRITAYIRLTITYRQFIEKYSEYLDVTGEDN